MLNGPGKLPPVTLKIEVSMVNVVCLPGTVCSVVTGLVGREYERYRVPSIIVVPFLINGCGYKKPGSRSVAQKHDPNDK